MAKAFRRKGAHVVATLSDLEREVVSTLMLQTRDVLAPTQRDHAGPGQAHPAQATAPQAADAFDELVADLGLDEDAAGGDGRAGGQDAAGADDPAGGEAAAARDPALDRLLPSANREDPEVAAEFRRLTEHGLRQHKSDNLTTSIDALLAVGDKDRLDLDRGQAQAFLVALVDVRLLLGERLGLRTDEDADALHGLLVHADPEDPRAVLATYYDFLTWLQESLTQALMR